MKSHPSGVGGADFASRDRLESRLDDLRGLGILSTASGIRIEDEEGLVALAHELSNSLETTQRRVIETSIQLLSLRELVSNLLSLRTPAQVAETAAIYLHKAFDHELALVGVLDPAGERLDGWVAIRNGDASCYPFTLSGEWGGALRKAVDENRDLRHPGMNGDGNMPFLLGDLPPELGPFSDESLGSYIIRPLKGHGGKTHRAVGVLAVARRAGSPPVGEMDADLLASTEESVATAMENVLLEEDVRREEAFRKDIMHSMRSGLVAVDLQGRVLTMNPFAEEITGYTLGALRGKEPLDLDPPGGGVVALLRKTLKNRQGMQRVERAVCRKNRSAFPAACTTTLLRNPAGDVYGAVATLEDLTEIRVMEERIRALDRLAALGRFTAAIAHEIRNPLTGIGAGVQYLERFLHEDPEQQENLTFICQEVERLNRIVEDLFRVTHPHPPRRIPESIADLAARAVRSMQTVAEEKGVAIHVDIAEDLPAVPVDADQVQQVLINLVKNAVEATPEKGEVLVRAEVSDGEFRPFMILEVRDTGPGFEEDAIQHVFEPFFTKGKRGGTGLGLYVSHGIVERHGGELHAANSEKRGAILKMKLPLTAYDATENA